MTRFVAAAAAAALAIVSAAASPGAAQVPSTCTQIVLDPGHDSMANPAKEPLGPGSRMLKIKDGGGTRGVATGTPEYVLTLQLAKRLRTLLVARNYCVTLTRDRATGLSLGNVDRARIANRAGAALLVRIHADGSTNHSQHGASMLYPALRSGWTDDILPESKNAARLLQAELVKRTGARDNGLSERGDLTGFNWADVPVVLTEVGFMSNPAEDRQLGRAEYQKKIAIGLERGIERFAPAG
ncbi:MAG: N-acetylmuramoyl-L-alanine amidase [Thermoleophilaceae bacterium]|nr:N-acetylmuramoyl-L-alanine amidase [Thermoleophilaceae bacterium]